MKIIIIVLLFLLSQPAMAQDNETNSHKVYTGKIGSKYPFILYLDNYGTQLTGHYRYAKQSASLGLEGTTDKVGQFTMKEYEYKADSKKITGTFSGRITGTTITGEWSNPDGTKKLSLEAHEATKKEILQNAVGIYSLTEIEGYYIGHTSDVHTRKEGGKWKSFSSGVAGNGTREIQDNTLSPSDIDMLNAMYVAVDTDLSVKFFAKGKLLLELPFNENGMEYHINESDQDGYKVSRIEKLSPSTTLLNSDLYLAAIDNMDYSGTISSDNFDLANNGTMIVSYYDPYFYIEIFGSSGFGNIFRFIKK